MPGSLIYAVARKGEKHSIVTLGRELRSQRAANNRICWHLGIKAESSRDSREKVIKERERAFLYPLRWHHPLNLTYIWAWALGQAVAQPVGSLLSMLMAMGEGRPQTTS